MRKRDSGRSPVKIWLMSDTRGVLKAIGRKGESYDAVIRRLVEAYPGFGAARVQELLGEEVEG